MKPGRTSGKARRRRAMAAAREAVKRAWDGWDLVGSDPTLDAAIEIEQPRWSSEKDHVYR